jgi:hypothetical protein
MAKRTTDHDLQRKIIAILRILDEAESPTGARAIANMLLDEGIDLTERAVRYHLQILDHRGLTEGLGEAGRLITEKGREELRNALVSDKLGFVISRIETLAYQTTFDLDTGRGDVILNVSLLPEESLPHAIGILKEVYAAGYSMGQLLTVAGAGEMIGPMHVPEGQAALGTVCSVTLNGVLLKQGVPMESKYGGLLQIEDGRPLRFTELIDYTGTTWDPLEIFIAGKLTSAHQAAVSGNGKIGASFRLVPAAARRRLQDVLAGMDKHGLGGVIAVGRPSQPLLEIQVDMEMMGLVVVAGLTPMAAVVESGIPAVNQAMKTLADYSILRPIEEF